MLPASQPYRKGYKYRIYPTAEQITLLNQTFGCCRYVYNRALAEAKAEYEYYLAHKDISATALVKPSLAGFSLANKLPSYKSDPQSLWLRDANSVALQQSLLNLGKAFSTFFKSRKSYPSFKSKQGHQSFTLMQNSFRLKDKEVFIAKSKDALNVNWSRDLPSSPSSAVISRTPTGKYYISFICEYTPEQTSGTGQIGIDLGLKDFLASSDGSKVSNPKHTKRYARQLRRVQQSLARKKKGSSNRTKAKLKVALCHEKIANTRNDFLHKLSTKLVNENQVIGLEMLKVANMVRNHKLAKSISDVSWSRFCAMLQYKAIASQHCMLVYMDTWYPSSQLCNTCGTQRDVKLKLSQRDWICTSCGTQHDRDTNAARNILKKALSEVANLQPSTDVRIILASV